MATITKLFDDERKNEINKKKHSFSVTIILEGICCIASRWKFNENIQNFLILESLVAE